MKKKMKNIINFILNENNEIIKDNLLSILFDNKLCDDIMGEGYYGLVIKKNNPNYVKIKINKKKMKLPVVIKNIKKHDDLKFDMIIKNKILYIYSYNNFIAETLILMYIRKLWFKTINLPLIINYMGCDNNLIDNITLIKYGLNEKYIMDVSDRTYNDDIFVKESQNLTFNSYMNTLNNLIYYIIYNNNYDDNNFTLPNGIKCNFIDIIDNITLVYLINFYFLRLNNVYIKDMHLDNIFINWFNEDYYFDNKNIKKSEYIYYKINDKYYKVKNYGFTIIIGDFGHSIINLKNDLFIIGNIYEGEFNEIDIETKYEFRNVDLLYKISNIIPLDIYKKTIIYKILSEKPYSQYCNVSLTYYLMDYIKKTKKTIELLDYFNEFENKYNKKDILIKVDKYF